MAAATQVTRVNVPSLSKGEGCLWWFLACLVTQFFPQSAHKNPRRQRGLLIRAYPLPLPDSGEVGGES